MKNNISIRILISALLISIVGGFICRFFYNNSPQAAIDVAAFQQELQAKETVAKKNLHQLAETFRPEQPNTAHTQNGLGIAFYVFSRNGLLYWTDNRPDISTLFVVEKNETRFVQLSNLSCLYISEVRDTLTYVALIKIKSSYPVDNELLVSRFSSSFDVPNSTGLRKSNSKSDHAVFDQQGQYLFSLVPPVVSDYNNKWAYAGIVFFSIAFLLLYLLYLYSHRFFKNRFTVKNYIQVTIPVLAVTLFCLYFNFPDILFWNGLFSPFEYASDSILGSIVHLSVFSAFLLAAISLYYFRVQVTGTNKKTGLFLQTLLYPLLLLLVYFMLTGLIYHSSFRLNILHFSDFSFNRIWLHFLVFIWGMCLVLLFYKARTKFTIKRTIAFDTVLFAFISVAAYFIFNSGFIYFITFYLLFTLSLYLPVILKKHFNIYALLAWWTLTYVLLFSIVTIQLDWKKKTDKYEVLCKNIQISGSTGNDAMADILLEELDGQISRDKTISRMVLQTDSVYYANSYINQTYLRGFWNKYDMRLSVASKNSEQATAYESYILTVGMQLKNTHFYSVPASFNDMSYLGIFPVPGVDSLQFYMEFYPRKNFRSYSFPNLFSPPSPDIQTQLGISTAKYENNKLLFSTGNTDFPETPRWIKKSSGEFFVTDYNNNKYFVYNPGHETYIVITEENPVKQSAILLYLFYTGLLFFGLISLITWTYQLSRKKWKIRIGLTAKFQYSFIILLVISFVGIFYVSVNFISQKYTDEQIAHIKNKKQYIQKELQEKYYWIQDLSAVNQQNLNFDLQELSYKYQTDIHVYDNKGFLVGSSQPLIFNKNLISRLISPKAFFTEDANIISEERIGELKYLTGYTDFYNGDYLQIGFIAVPQYFSRVEIRAEIEEFLSVIIHIYLIIIILVVLLSLFIGKQLSAPLNMLQQKLRQMRFGERNEKIDYTLNDEIGQLVVQYNKTVDELERSARMLAQSERESAWKTMARQIAHEINNPLTPMKLTIQQLQRTYNPNDERFDDYFRKSTKTLIEQIDNLSRIAATFSNFAKMPEARFERFNITERLRSVVQLFANNHEGTELTFEDDAQAIFVMADPEQLTQVFNNLLKNAIQSIPSDRNGWIIVAIASDQKNVIINITDNGCGISDDITDKLFTPNFTTKSTGTGLGLAISKNIVEIAGGTITFATRYNEGTTFTVTLHVDK